MLHITDGESVAGTLRKSALPGDVSTYGDLMYEGPAPAGLDSEAWREVRARFLVDAGYASLGEARRYLQACEDTLAAFSQHEEVVIWLDHRLSDQLILIKVLDWFSRRDLGGVQLSLVRTELYSGSQPFIGLGRLDADELASLAGTRTSVSDAQHRTAQTAWLAFTSPDPTEIERFIATDTSSLPFIASALKRHLQQFPCVDGGLSRTERQALSVLREQGTLSGARLFVTVQSSEEAVFMGDVSFYLLMSDLASVPHPLVQISDTVDNRLGLVTITPTGMDVLDGRVDHIDLNGVDRWLGGVHLQSGKAEWRWDRAAERLVRHR